MSVTSRADDIRERLKVYWLDEMGCPVSPMPRHKWDPVLDQLGPYAIYGVAWPLPFDDPQGPLIIPFQAELIADVTSHLSDEDLSDYLDAIEHLLELQVTQRIDGASPEAAVSAAEAELDEHCKGSIILIQNTHLAALDRWAGG